VQKKTTQTILHAVWITHSLWDITLHQFQKFHFVSLLGSNTRQKNSTTSNYFTSLRFMHIHNSRHKHIVFKHIYYIYCQAFSTLPENNSSA